MDDWIAVSERLPEKREKPYQVIALCVKRYKEMCYAGEPIRGIYQDWVLRNWPQNYTHWMPFPALPASGVGACPLGCTATENCAAIRDGCGSECVAKPFQLRTDGVALPAATFCEGNWSHPDGDGSRIVGWRIPAADVQRMGVDAYRLPGEVVDALAKLAAAGVPVVHPPVRGGISE